MRKNAKNLILNSDKVDDVWEQAPKAIKRIPKFGGVLGQLVKFLPNPGKHVELLLVEQFVMMTSAMPRPRVAGAEASRCAGITCARNETWIRVAAVAPRAVAREEVAAG